MVNKNYLMNNKMLDMLKSKALNQKHINKCLHNLDRLYRYCYKSNMANYIDYMNLK